MTHPTLDLLVYAILFVLHIYFQNLVNVQNRVKYLKEAERHRKGVHSLGGVHSLRGVHSQEEGTFTRFFIIISIVNINIHFALLISFAAPIYQQIYKYIFDIYKHSTETTE